MATLKKEKRQPINWMVSEVTKIKMPKMKENEIEQLINEQFLCRIAFRGDLQPYIAPFQYVVLDGALYFHFTDYGKKMSFFKQETLVCVEIERYTPNLSEYQFVVLTGKLRLVADHEERKMAIEKMAESGELRLSPNFLVAHGFSQGSDWGDFSDEKPILIIKLDEVTEKTGLKSP
jgi:nitroimidazol reductase NimA-like FMN-containing flavoprotein (pyridoxamine 5'-phosphate oxidase superfamily)